MNDATAAVRALHIPDAGSGWSLIMQSGAILPCMTGIPLERLLLKEFALPVAKLAKIDVLLLDGKPVDAPKTTLVPAHSRLALAAGLPGIAGLAMKSGSAVRGLRPGITHRQAEDAAPEPRRARIELALFSLALPLLAGHFLRRGVLVAAGRVLPYLRPAITQRCILDGRPVSREEAVAQLDALPENALVELTAELEE